VDRDALCPHGALVHEAAVLLREHTLGLGTVQGDGEHPVLDRLALGVEDAPGNVQVEDEQLRWDHEMDLLGRLAFDGDVSVRQVFACVRTTNVDGDLLRGQGCEARESLGVRQYLWNVQAARVLIRADPDLHA